MIKEPTYTEILSEIRDFFERHQLVNSFIDGQPYDFAAKDNIYSAVVLVPTISTVQGTMLSLAFDLYFVDRIVEDGSNTKDVYNDELQIALDFISYFSERNTKWNLEAENISLQPFEQKFDDILAGWQLSVSVLVPFHKNICDIPLNDVEPTPLPPYADFSAYVLGNKVTLVNKSQYYDEISWQYDGAHVQSLKEGAVILYYDNPGTYTITLTAKNEGWNDSISTKTITII